MNNRVDGFAEDTAVSRFGVIFADLNGLKKINDTQGHAAGDCLLKNAANKLRESFGDCEIYRAGGDEFMILACNLPESELVSRVEKLREESRQPGGITPDVVSFSLGLCCETNLSAIRAAMRKADERMYADKECYYQQFAERWRK